MQYTMIYNDSFRGDNEVEWFQNKCNMIGRAESIEELAEKTDIGFIQSCNWDDHIKEAMPFIERGKPVFLDKPLVGSVKDIKKIRELAANGAQNYINWNEMYSYHPMGDRSFAKAVEGIFYPNDEFFKLGGGIYRDSEYYLSKF